MAGFGLEGEEKEDAEPSSSKDVVLEGEENSENDFSPEDNTHSQDADGEIDDEIVREDVQQVSKPSARRNLTVKGSPSNAKGKQKAKVKDEESSTVPPVGPPTAKRQNYALPTPSVHHRHRAVPLYSRPGLVERLISRPHLFQDSEFSLTNGLTENAKISDRVNKSWGYNIGPGPLWDLVEDRGWVKEAIIIGADVDSEAKRRPRVYREIRTRNGSGFLDSGDAAPYLPTDDTTTEEGNLKPPPPVKCYFGSTKLGQTREDVPMFTSIPMTNYYQEAKSHVFNAGAPVWSLDWCPIHIEDRAARSYKQYLAVGPFPSHSHSPDIGRKVARPSYACIQIWSLSKSNPPFQVSGLPQKKRDGKKPAASATTTTSTDTSTSVNLEIGNMKCEMVLCLDIGPAYSLKWCPLPSHDLIADSMSHKKLGLLGGTFEDGSFSIFVVPEPPEMASIDDKTSPVYVKLSRPILRIELEETACWSFDWANSEVIAIGTTSGTILVYDVGKALKQAAEEDQPTITDLLPTYHLCVHQSAIRAIAWIKAPPFSPEGVPQLHQDPTVIASAGYDGMECLTDIREGRGSVMNRTRDVLNALVFSPFAGGPITMDHENTVKSYSASPSMLGRGHALFEPQGPVWSVGASDYHPQLAIGSADGSCSTTNMLRSTRRGGSVPFFVHRIFQMDYNRNTKEYRMLDRFLPQETHDRQTATRTSKAKGKSKDEKQNEIPISTGAWPKEVGVHVVVWNTGNGLASSALLAAGTASGLCRVDLLWGRWVRNREAYGGVAVIRMEDVNAMDVDSNVSDDGESDG